MKDQDHADQLQKAVLEAVEKKTPLVIQGGQTKAFYGREIEGEVLSTKDHKGIIDYQPKELVVRARSGTLLADVESVLASENQMLAFEPPHFGSGGTLGGAIASGLSGPRRAYAGSVRDFVLGVGMINGRGQSLGFGGQVMKNVAGYDISRLMAGSMGTLGVILDVSLKVLPIAQEEMTLMVQCTNRSQAIKKMNDLARTDTALSASFFDGELLYLRLSGVASALKAGHKSIGGEQLFSNAIWKSIRDHQHAFFKRDAPLWRVSLPSDAPDLYQYSEQVVEWGGALRWIYSDETPKAIRARIKKVGGHATLFNRNDKATEVFHPLDQGLIKLHQNLKQAFDPHRILNPGRIYKDL